MPSSPIIVGLARRDDDASPLALARRLAELSDAPLVLVNACLRDTPPPLSAPRFDAAVSDKAAEDLDSVARELDGVDVSTRVRFGSPSGVIHGAAEELGAQAIVVGSTHRGTLGRVLIGDVAVGLLHGSPCTVAVAPRGYDKKAGADWRRIGVAFDGSPESDQALTAAIGLAGRTGGHVWSFTILEPTEYSPAYTAPGWVPSPAYEERRREIAQSIAERALVGVPAGAVASSEVLHGRTVPALADISGELDLLVCGSRGYGALHSVMAGGVSRGLARSAACPLLVVPRRRAERGDDVRALTGEIRSEH